MITRDYAAACSGRGRVSDCCAALIGIIRNANVGWTRETASRGLAFKGADVSAVAARSIGDAGVIERSWQTALIKYGARRDACIDRGAAGQESHCLGRAAIVRQRRQHRVGAGLVAGACEPRCFGGVAKKVMAITGDGAVNIGPGSRGAAAVAAAVSSGITGDDCVFQSHARRADADAAARTFGYKTRWLGSSALIDTGVASLSVVNTERCVLYIHGRRAIGNSAAIREAAGAVHATTAADLSAVAAVTTKREVVGKRRGVDDHGSTVGEDRAAAGATAVTRIMTTQAARAEGIAAAAAVGSGQVECGVGYR